MAKDVKAFLKIKRLDTQYRPVCERLKDSREVNVPRSKNTTRDQVSRCMDCGTPFCHWACPIGNYIPEWNDLVLNGHWEKAFQLLEGTNNLPEITGRVCPAPCEFGCVLGVNDDPVTIRENELAIIEHAFKHKLIKPNPPFVRSGKKVAVIGSGPAGLSCAAQLNKAGHSITVYEKDDAIGGILRYGIPDFKLNKRIINRRIKIYKKEGIQFKTGINVGVNLAASKLKEMYDAICLTGGSRVPRDLNIEGRNLKGIHFAMDCLVQNNRRIAGQKIPEKELIDAKAKRVAIIGGGDTGSDCVGTAHRQGAACVVQIELLPKPPQCRSQDYSWPTYPLLLKSSSSHEEGGQRQWCILTKKFIGESGKVKKISCVRVEFSTQSPKTCQVMKEIPGSEFEIDADLVILAIGFVHPQHNGLLSELEVQLDERGNVKTDQSFMTSVDGIFSAGDMRRGQSLIVWAISEGRSAAHHIDKYLRGTTNLPLF